MILALLLAATAQTSCPQFFANGVAPAVVVDAFLCKDGFAVGYDAAWGDPRWSAQVETPASIAAAKKTARNGAFKACDELPADEQISPGVYAKSGYDIGHMSESAASADKPATFILCNAVPQAPNLNRLVWAKIEKSLRNLAASGDQLYIVTGPDVAADAPRLAGKVAIPFRTWKAVYDLSKGTAGAWTCTNTQTPMPVCTQETIGALQMETGFDPFPGVAASVKLTSWMLPPLTKGDP